MSVYQIVYMSAQTVDFDDSALRELLTVARKNNQALAVSGMLLFHEGCFIQVLEGKKESVEQLFEKISLDKRHKNTTVILKGQAEERTFDDWAMGYLPSKTLRDIPEGFHPFLKSGFKSDDDSENAVRNALHAFRDGRWRARL